MYKSKQKFDLTSNKGLAIAGSVIVLVIVLGKSIISRLSSGLSFLGAKKDQTALVNETLNNPIGVRYTFVKGIIDTIQKEINATWNTSEPAIVAEMNKLQSPEEVVFASNYYMQQFGVSLKSILREELDADWRGTDGSYSKLKPLIKNNLL